MSSQKFANVGKVLYLSVEKKPELTNSDMKTKVGIKYEPTTPFIGSFYIMDEFDNILCRGIKMKCSRADCST